MLRCSIQRWQEHSRAGGDAQQLHSEMKKWIEEIPKEQREEWSVSVLFDFNGIAKGVKSWQLEDVIERRNSCTSLEQRSLTKPRPSMVTWNTRAMVFT